MASFVEDTLTRVDNAILSYAQNSFSAFAGPIASVLQVMGIVGVAFIALNALTQWAPIRVSEYLRWGVRYVVITAVATSWAQFAPIYNIVTNTPGELGATLLGVVSAPNINGAFDQMITVLFDFSDTMGANSGLFGISMASIVVWIIGGLMAASAIIVISLGKIGLGMAIALAPIFIPALMFKATSNLFESWVRFTLGFALIPLVMAGVVGAIVGIGQAMMTQASTATDLEGAAGFLIVGTGAVFMTLMVPSLVNGLSGTITATANGVAMAAGAAGVGVAAAAGTYAGGRKVQQTVTPLVRGEMEAQAAGRAAKASGGNAVEARSAERARQKSIRQKYADRASGMAAMHGRQASAAERFQAANAGQKLDNRKARRSRKDPKSST